MKQILSHLWRDEEGQSLSEYQLLLMLIVLAAVCTVSTLANVVVTKYATTAARLTRTIQVIPTSGPLGQ